MLNEERHLLEKAINWAVLAHVGQTDKIGLPYILHPLAVMLSLPAHDVEGRIVAVLHDTVEDTAMSLDMLAGWLPEPMLGAVDAMTKRKGEELEAYWGRVKANRIALRVKRADIAHNTSPERLDCLDNHTAERLKKKYSRAIRFLDSPG